MLVAHGHANKGGHQLLQLHVAQDGDACELDIAQRDKRLGIFGGLFLRQYFVHGCANGARFVDLTRFGLGFRFVVVFAGHGLGPFGHGQVCFIFNRAQHGACVFGQNGVVKF